MYFIVWPNLYIFKNTDVNNFNKPQAKSATKIYYFWVTSFSWHFNLIKRRLKHTIGWKED